jgi:hypothetical protein
MRVVMEKMIEDSEPDDPSPSFIDNRGEFTGNDAIATYDSRTEMPGNFSLIRIGPGSAIRGSLIDLSWGDSPKPILPIPLPSTVRERTELREELLKLAKVVESVMLPYGMPTHEGLKKLGVPPEEDFHARVLKVRERIHKIDEEATACYNQECRPSVIQVYGHARSIGYTDTTTERIWTADIGVAAKQMPDGLRRVAAKIIE